MELIELVRISFQDSFAENANSAKYSANSSNSANGIIGPTICGRVLEIRPTIYERVPGFRVPLGLPENSVDI